MHLLFLFLLASAIPIHHNQRQQIYFPAFPRNTESAANFIAQSQCWVHLYNKCVSCSSFCSGSGAGDISAVSTTSIVVLVCVILITSCSSHASTVCISTSHLAVVVRRPCKPCYDADHWTERKKSREKTEKLSLFLVLARGDSFLHLRWHWIRPDVGRSLLWFFRLHIYCLVIFPPFFPGKKSIPSYSASLAHLICLPRLGFCCCRRNPLKSMPTSKQFSYSYNLSSSPSFFILLLPSTIHWLKDLTLSLSFLSLPEKEKKKKGK